MKSYGVAALTPLATRHLPAPPGEPGDPVVPGRETTAIAMANLQIKLPEFDPKNVPGLAEEFCELLLLIGQQHADLTTKCTLIKKLCKKKFLQRQVNTAIRNCSNWGEALKRLEQMYPVCVTHLSVPAENEELPSFPEFPTAARISEFVAQLEELMGRMNLTSYGPIEPHLRIVERVPSKTWEKCRETSERKAATHSYDYLVDLLIHLAMEREGDFHMDKYLRKHLRRETRAENSPGGQSPQLHSNPGKGRDGQLKYMKEAHAPMVKGPPMFSTVVLQTIRVDSATRPNVMGNVPACWNCTAGR